MDVRFWRGSPRGRESGQWRGGLGSTDSVTDASRGRGRISALGGGVYAGGRMVNGAGDLVNGLCRGLAGGNGCPLWEGYTLTPSPSPHEHGRGGRARGIWSTDSVADSRAGTDVRFGEGYTLTPSPSPHEHGRGGHARGDLVNGLCHGLAGGNGCPLWEGESPRGRED